jgi:hypothetical protein
VAERDRHIATIHFVLVHFEDDLTHSDDASQAHVHRKLALEANGDWSKPSTVAR